MQYVVWLVVLGITTVQTVLSIRPMPNDIRKVYKARMSKKTFERVKNLHMNWYVHAIKALFGQIGKQLYQQLTKGEQKVLAACLDQIEDERDLSAGAKCLIQARYEALRTGDNWGNSVTQQPKAASDSPAFIVASIPDEEQIKSSEADDSGRKIIENFQKKSDMKRNFQPPIFTGNSGNLRYSARFDPDPIEVKPVSSNPGTENASSEFETFIRSEEFSRARRFTPNIFRPSILRFNDSGKVAFASSHPKTFGFVVRQRSVADPRKSEQLYVKSKRHLVSGEENLENRFFIKNNAGNVLDSAEQPVISATYGNTAKAKPGAVYSRTAKSDNVSFPGRPAVFGKTIARKLGHTDSGIFWKQRGGRHRWKRSPYRLIANHVMKSDSVITDVKQVNKMPPLHDPITKKTPIQQMSKFINVVLRGKEAGGNWTETYERITKFKKQMDQRSRSPGAKVYEFRLFDLVLGNEHPSKPKVRSSYKDFFSLAFDFINGLRRNHKNNEMNFRFLSPRLMPVMPDKIEAKERILSPSVMSFYKDDSSDSIASLPKLLEETGMSEKDRQAVIEMVMDVSGARVAVEMALDVLKETNIFGFEDKIVEATERISNVFSNLEKSFNEEQSKDMASKGYTFLEVPQMEEVLYHHGVKKPKDVNFDVENYAKLDRRQRENVLWENIERIAQNGTEKGNRTKREAISVLAPVILAPFMFSPIFGLTILGPVVLSPSIFSPLILNPSILGPFVLSPALFLPFLISPYILSPYVMTPIFGAPFILNPYILSPNVINPYIISPLVLSPYVFSPDVLSPQALGGQILSPSAFSPSIYTQSVLMASILSPSWMSK